MEVASSKWRGVVSGMLQQGYSLGNLLSAIMFLSIFPHVGWRYLFLISATTFPCAILYIRCTMPESEVWERSRSENTKTILKDLRSNGRMFLYLVVFLASLNMLSHGTQDLWPTNGSKNTRNN